jgi:hypothetical protein
MHMILVLVLAFGSLVSGNYVRDITGKGLTDGVLAMYDADLGIIRYDADRKANAIMFGDNFEYQYMQGEWRSPSVVMYDENFNALGIPTGKSGISLSRVQQLWPYEHNNGIYTTLLPCDFIKIGSIWYVAVMKTQGLGNELSTDFWSSSDLVSWNGPIMSLPHPSHPGNVMLTFDIIDDYVYIFGTGGLARNLPLWLWRNPVKDFPFGWWEPWGYDGFTWGWGIANENTPVMAGSFGEICFRYIDQKTVLSYFDAGRYKMTALVVDYPWSNLYSGNFIDYASGSTTPQLYGGYISPQSKLDDKNGMKFVVSQWITSTNDPYKAMVFEGTLTASHFIAMSNRTNFEFTNQFQSKNADA